MSYQAFTEARNQYNANDREASFPTGIDAAESVHILWMYPDILHMHGGRGNLMALARYAMSMGLLLTIRKCKSLGDDIDFDWADMVLFESGDLSVMGDVISALRPSKDKIGDFAASGRPVMAIGSSGAILGKETKLVSGEIIEGLGLLDMNMEERTYIYGDDMLIETDFGMEIIGSQIQRADIFLSEGQAPFGRLSYGRGNNDNSGNDEGARTGDLIFTNCLGPIFVRNPMFAEYMLRLAAKASGRVGNADDLRIKDEDISLEVRAYEDMKEFMLSKKSK